MLVPRPISSRMTRLRRCGVVQDVRRFGHLDHEGTLAARQLVAGSDTREDAIGDADFGFLGRDKTADLRHQRDQRHLADVGALAGHVRAGDQQDRTIFVAAPRIIGDKRAFRFDDIQHRMPSVHDVQHGAVHNLRAAIATLAGEFGQRQPACRPEPIRPPWPATGVRRVDQVPQLTEQVVFQVLGFLVRRENLFFVLLQFGRDVTLRILERLFANEVVRDFVAMDVGHLDVIAEDPVVTNLQAGNPGVLDLVRLISGNPLFTALRQSAQFIQGRMKTLPNETAFAQRQRALLDQGRLQLRSHVGTQSPGRLPTVAVDDFAGPSASP